MHRVASTKSNVLATSHPSPMTSSYFSPPLVSIILAGGKGERFWPLSRLDRPKQFLSLDGSGLSLLQTTADRLLIPAQGWENLWVITSAQLADGVREQLPELPEANLLVEPEGRDTAPAVTWSILEVVKRYGEDVVMAFFPADHWITEPEKFVQTLEAARHVALKSQTIVTLGITPTFPSTGYGYIAQGKLLSPDVQSPQGIAAYKVDRFTEKPDRETAEAFIETGLYSWNAGMFVFQGKVALDEIRRYAPEILEPLEAKGIAAYSELPKKSIDYALMEPTQKATVLPVTFAWDDLGDWGAIERLLKSDKPNVEVAKHVGLDTQGALLYSTQEDELIVTIGLDDVVIVRDGKVTLIVKKDRTQDIKQVLKTLRADPELEHHL